MKIRKKTTTVLSHIRNIAIIGMLLGATANMQSAYAEIIEEVVVGTANNNAYVTADVAICTSDMTNCCPDCQYFNTQVNKCVTVNSEHCKFCSSNSQAARCK